jgi:hypothetical protein
MAGMQLKQIYRAAYWFGFTVLMAALMASSYPTFFKAWITALFFLPSVVALQYGWERSMEADPGPRRVIRVIFWALLTVYLSYMALLGSYWYFLELQPDQFDLTLVNPVFIWTTLGFFVGLEWFLFKKGPPKESESITIFSNRKKTVLEINRIAYVESRGDFTVAFLSDGSEYKNNVKITQWQERLDGFLRIHRSFLVNPEMAVLHGSAVTVNGKWELPVSRGHKKKVDDFFEK